MAERQLLSDVENRDEGHDTFPSSPLAQVFQCKAHEDDSEIVIYAAISFAYSVDFESFVSLMQEKVLSVKRFRSILVKQGNGAWEWLPVNVNIHEHVNIVDLPKNSLEHEGTDAAVEFGNQLMNVPLSPEKPQWEVYILRSSTQEIGDKLLFRIHHSLGDGISMASLFLDLVETKQCTVPSLPEPRKEFKKKPVEVIASSFSYFFNTLFSLSRLSLLLISGDVLAGVKVRRSVRHQPRDLASLRLPLKDLKEVGKILGATINDVFLALISAAMDKLVRAQARASGEVSRWSESDDLPKYRPSGVVVVNLRPPLTRSELDSMRKTGGESSKWGTVAGYVVVKLPVNRVGGPLERLGMVKGEMDRAKHSGEAMVSKFAMDFIGQLFGPHVLLSFLNYIANQSTCTVSNVAGPQEEVHLHGNPVKSMYQFASGLPNGAAFHFLGYADSAFLCISTHAATVSADTLLAHFSESFEEIKLAAQAAVR